MAHLFRPTYRKVDPETGERVEYRLHKWYANYKDADGKRCRVPLSEDKSSAQTMLGEILRTVERQKAGLIDKALDKLQEPVENAVDDYQKHLESKGRSKKHISETVRQIRKLVKEADFEVLLDLQRSEDSIERFLASRREEGISHRTINAHLAAIRSFCRWLTQKNRLSADPTVHLEKLDEGVDRRLERRPLTDQEATKLFTTTLESKDIFRGLSGVDRAMLYMLAQRSGLRRGELVTLTPQSFNLKKDTPTVRVEAPNSKNRKTDEVPLPAEVAKELASYLEGKPRKKPVWPGNWWEKSAEMFRIDLAASGIEIVDAEKKVLDFHGQRMTYISGLARAGVSPTKAQKLARHSDVNLTMQSYTHLKSEDLASAVESLPSLRVNNQLDIRRVSGGEMERDPMLKQVIDAWPILSSENRRSIASIVTHSLSAQDE